jgi:hypothetical protein
LMVRSLQVDLATRHQRTVFQNTSNERTPYRLKSY